MLDPLWSTPRSSYSVVSRRLVRVFLLLQCLISVSVAVLSNTAFPSRIHSQSRCFLHKRCHNRPQTIASNPFIAPSPSVQDATSRSDSLLLGLRGGSLEGLPVEDALDWNRVRLRLEGLSAYTVVSALLVNASLRLFTATPKKLEYGADQRSDNRAKILFGASMVVSILAGLHTTVVFSLFGLYSKTALGLGNDPAYRDFLRATQAARHRAYDTFVVSLVAFQCSLVSGLFLTYGGPSRWWAAGLAGLAALASVWQWGRILAVAGRLIFANPS